MTNTPDPQIIEQLNVLSKKFDEAFNNNDATAVVACFTEDAVLVTDTGPIYGREAIEEYQADAFHEARHSNHIRRRDQYSPHMIGTTGDEEWETGEWSCILNGDTSDAIEAKGYWSSICVREGDAWKCRMLTWNVTPGSPPAETR
jgi:ketosteroid isomerase-like protein